MKVFAMTQKGKLKCKNEDRIIINKSILSSGALCDKTEKGIFAVADGVGGNNAGAVASHFLANKLCILEKISVETLSRINDELIDYSEKHSELNGMATTLSGIQVNEENIVIFHTGNTRVYQIRGEHYLKQLTSDDTTVNYLLYTGNITEKEAKESDKKNEITACYGGGNKKLLKVDIQSFDCRRTCFLLSSDGIHDFVSIDEMEDIIHTYGISLKACDKFISVARANGSDDDASILILRCDAVVKNDI